MAKKGVISEFFDLEALKEQRNQAATIIESFLSIITKPKPSTGLDDKKIKDAIAGTKQFTSAIGDLKKIGDQFSGTFGKLNDATAKYDKTVSDLSLSVKEYEKVNDQAATTQAKLNVAETEAAKALIAKKIALQQSNQAAKDEIQLNSAAEGSVRQKQIQLKVLQRQYDDLSSDQRNSEQGQSLKKQIQDLDREVKTLEGDTGRFKRSVGEYASAFGNAFTVLNRALTEVRKQIASGEFSGQALKELQEREKVLQEQTDKLGGSFATATEQQKAFQKSAVEIGATFGQTSDLFQHFRDQVGHGISELNDLKESIKEAASNTKELDKLIGAAEALAAGFAIAEGAAALFGEENESVHRTLVKLEAVMAILNGLHSIQNELKNKDSILSKILLFIKGQEVKATVAHTAAVKAEAAATVEASAATGLFTGTLRLLRAALVATGIGAMIALIGYLIEVIGNWIYADEKAIEMQKKLAEAMAQVIATQRERIETIKTEGEVSIRALEREIELRKAAGLTQAEQLALDKTVAKERERIASQQIATYDLSQAKADKFFRQYKQAMDVLIELEADRYKAIKRNDESTAEELQKQIDAVKAVAENNKAAYDLNVNILNDLAEAKQKQALIDVQTQRLTEEEKRKFILESARYESDLIIDKNNRILASEKSTEAQRLAAVRAIEVERKKQAQAELTNIQQDPTISEKMKALAVIKANADIEKATRDSAQQQYQIKKEFADRERKALSEILIAQLDDRRANSEQIMNNERKSFSDRIAAAEDVYNKELQIINSKREVDIANTALTEQERMAIIAKYQEEELTAKRNFLQASYAIVIDSLDAEQKARLKASGAIRDKEIIALNELYDKKLITQEEYDRKRADIENKATQDELNALIERLNKEIAKRKAHGENVIDLETQLSRALADLSDTTSQHLIDNEERVWQSREKKLSSYSKAAESTYSIISELSSISLDGELSRIEEQMNLIDKRKEKEIDAVNATALNSQEKAAQVKLIEARAANEKEQQDRRRRQLESEQAKFAKVANVGKIISETALAVVTTLADKTIQPGFLRIPLAATVGILGAAQLARAIAAPLPRYAEGTPEEGHPGGLAVVGDAGKKEPIITPDGRLTMSPASTTIMDLPKGTHVFKSVDHFDRLVELSLLNALKVPTHNTGAGYQQVLQMKKIENKLTDVQMEIRNKPEPRIRNTFRGVESSYRYGANWYKYLNDQL